MVPVFTAAGQSPRDWIVQQTAAEREASGRRFEFVSRSKTSEVTATTALQAFSDAPILQFQTEFHNTGKTPCAARTDNLMLVST